MSNITFRTILLLAVLAFWVPKNSLAAVQAIPLAGAIAIGAVGTATYYAKNPDAADDVAASASRFAHNVWAANSALTSAATGTAYALGGALWATWDDALARLNSDPNSADNYPGLSGYIGALPIIGTPPPGATKLPGSYEYNAFGLFHVVWKTPVVQSTAAEAACNQLAAQMGSPACGVVINNSLQTIGGWSGWTAYGVTSQEQVGGLYQSTYFPYDASVSTWTTAPDMEKFSGPDALSQPGVPEDLRQLMKDFSSIVHSFAGTAEQAVAATEDNPLVAPTAAQIQAYIHAAAAAAGQSALAAAQAALAADPTNLALQAQVAKLIAEMQGDAADDIEEAIEEDISYTPDDRAIDWSPLTEAADSLGTKFPVSGVVALSGLFGLLHTSGVAPVFHVPIGQWTMDLDLSVADPLALLTRWLFSIFFICMTVRMVVKQWSN